MCQIWQIAFFAGYMARFLDRIKDYASCWLMNINKVIILSNPAFCQELSPNSQREWRFAATKKLKQV
jgi:hypothetical protein